MRDTILVVNAGSSSIKFQLYEIASDATLSRQLKGQLDGIGSRPKYRVRGAAGAVLIDETLPREAVPDVDVAMARIAGWLRERTGGTLPVAIGHRVVHGGAHYAAPTVVDSRVIADLERLIPLAPLHQPANLAPIRALHANHPQIPQVACFDTAFHRGHPELADRYAIPEELYRDGVRRYGFHGLSYEYIASRLPTVAPEIAGGHVVVAHLGSGASMCALRAGKSVDSTMGFSALDGLPMGTRPGQLDPTVVLYLLTQKGMTPAEAERLLYRDCGLKGISGISNDVRDLLQSSEPRARLALDYFSYRIARELGALAAALGGLDGLVFTAGIGENAPAVRADVCARSTWLGIRLDPRANAQGSQCISTAQSTVGVYVVPTDEELMIASHTLAIAQAKLKRSV
jgi:acetate kinase